MESNYSDKEKLTPDDSLETEMTASELESKDEKPAPEPTEPEGGPDFDVRPADTYLGPDYDPKKSAGPKALWLGVLMVAAIIGLTYYAFRSQPVPDQGDEMTAQEKAAIVSPDTASGQQLPTLPEKAPDAADFSPTPEAEAAAAAPASLPATASSSTPPVPAREPAALTTAATTGKAKAGSGKNAASTQKSKKDEAKASSTKSTATTAKPAETKPATAETKAATEPKAEQTKPEATKPDDTQPAVPATASAAEAKPAPTENAPAVTPGEISDLWVVNISSTPDLAESNRLLNRVIAADVGGQVYFYETTIDDRVHHRIRVGFFNSRGEAEAMGQKVKEAFKLSATPWAVKPTVEEVERYQKK